MRKSIMAAAIAAACMAFTASAVNAAQVSFDLEWVINGDLGPLLSGVAGAGGDATATLIVDDSLLASGFDFFDVPPETIPILGFQLNILNSALGPDSFGLNDLFYAFATAGPIDPNLDLLSQENFLDFNVFPPGGLTVDALDGFGPVATDTGVFPQGVGPNTFAFGEDVFELSSFAPSAVPLPAPLAMLLAALVGLAWIRRRA